MSKATYLDDLILAHRVEFNGRADRCKAPYKNLDKSRIQEVFDAHNRRVINQSRRSAGKRNKLRCRRTAKGMRENLKSLEAWVSIFGRSCYVMGNSGTPKSEIRIRQEAAQ
ncbi:hypothetical protein [Leclercia adecarboxylata]|uniref:hypothetical protein n=1 Tax=Leclercia adecarboxylata TaxID=83655 RepID=UPI0022E1714B|nr:hypothetical protein [Leclercia adecarboxylata]